MLYAFVILLPVIALVVAWLLRGDWRPAPEVKIVRPASPGGPPKRKPGINATPEQWAVLLDELESLGFYDNVPAASRPAAKRRDLDARWPFAHEPNTLVPADAENIAEGFAGAWLVENAALLAEYGVRPATVRDVEDGNSRHLEVDGRLFLISSHLNNGHTAWFAAVERFLLAVNELLASAGSECRLFWICGAEDGAVALLKPDVHRAISRARLIEPHSWMYED